MYDQSEQAPIDAMPAVEPEVPVWHLIAQHPNLASELPDQKLGQIAQDVLRMHDIDKTSMGDWYERMKKGIELANLAKEKKSYPFENAANVKYPLVTTAALQFNARAYPAVVPSGDIVKCKTHGADPAGNKAKRSERISEHMSYQLATEIEEWDSETDKMLVQLPIVGTMYRKIWYDPVAGRQRCRVVAPGKLVINDKVTSLEAAPRLGEEITLYPYEIEERIRSGQYLPGDYFIEEDGDDQSPQDFIEQHTRIDLDEDGYAEPYVVIVHVKTQKVARIVANFEVEGVAVGQDMGIVSAKADTYYIDYHFLPGMDGGFHGTGLGLLLGDISETVNSIINMLMDAGHMASLGGGFIGSEMRIKGGSQRFQPGEWKKASATGGDIQRAIVPMTFPAPDGTLFQLLGLLIEAAKEVSSTKDIMTGDSGTKNMTATTTIALIEQGMMVFTAAYKRIFRSLKREFKMIARNNVKHLDAAQYNAFHDVEQAPAMGHNGGPPLDPRADYGAADLDVEPVADPRSVTKMQEAAKAEFLGGLAQQGLVDPQEASRRMLEAMSISDVDDLMPKPNPAAQMMEQMQMQGAQAELMLKKISIEQAIADIEETRSKAVKNVTDATTQRRAQSLDEMKLKLETLNAGITEALAGASERMAQGPGNTVPPQGTDPLTGGAGGGMQGRILPGQGMV